MKNKMTMKEIVAEYNELTGLSIKRFSSVPAGILRLRKVRKEGFATKPPKGNKFRDRHEAASETWNNPQIATKRKKRHSVKVYVDGTKSFNQYPSVAAAFKHLELPMGVHIDFRQKLVKLGKCEINNHKFVLDKGE